MKKRMLSLLLCGAMCTGLLSGCGNASSAEVLNVYNWGEYIDTDLIDQFEEETGIKVIYNTFDSNENLYSRIQTTSYDVIIPSDYAISRFINEDMLQPLNYDHIPNMKLIDEKYTHLDFDPEQKYSVPYTWGVVGIVYNTKYVDKADIGSWDLLWNPKYTNRTAMFNNSRDALGIALMYLGYSLNTTDKEEAINDLCRLYERMVMRRHTNGGHDHVLGELWRQCENFNANVVIMYQHVCCKTMAGLQGLFDDQARELGIHLIWVEHDLMDPRTVSRKDMRGRVNNYMVNVMHAEPVDATLIDIDDEVTW